MFDPANLRVRCRNPRCRCKLEFPTENLRNAFCTPGCHTSFYRHRCLVCEQPIERKSEKRQICNRPKCRYAFRADRARFLGRGYGSATNAEFDARSARKSGVSNRQKPGEWRTIAGPDLGPNFPAAVVPDGPNCQWAGGEFERIEIKSRAALKAHFAELAKKCLYQRDTPPTNLIGGYKFPDAPTASEVGLTRSTIADAVVTVDPVPARVAVLTIPADLSIPEFLKRTGGV
jgi:hypothetical protein